MTANAHLANCADCGREIQARIHRPKLYCPECSRRRYLAASRASKEKRKAGIPVVEYGVKVLGYTRVAGIDVDDYIDYMGSKFTTDDFKVSLAAGVIPPGTVVLKNSITYLVVGRYMQACSLVRYAEYIGVTPS